MTKMKILNPCPRCENGSILMDYEGLFCLACGYDPEATQARKFNLAYMKRLQLAGLRPPKGDYASDWVAFRTN